MNKKLIDKYGFKQSELDGYCCFKVINGNLIEYNEDLQELYIFNNDIGAGDPASVTTQTSVRGVVALILDCTGVDLAKKTKREEIEELKTGLKALVEKAEDSEAVFDARLKGYFMSIVDTVQAQEAKIESLEDAIKSQNEAVEDLKGCISPTKRKYFLGMDFSIDAADALRYSVNQMIRKDVNKLIEQGDERILSKLKPIDTSKLKQVIKNMQGMFDKQASEMQAEEKKGFSVGDRVCVTDDYEDARKGSVGVIDFPTFGTFYSDNEYYIGFHGMATWVHEDNLEHAPAERPKEKALEFGDPLECMVSKFHLKIGQKVIFLRVETPVPNNVRYIVSTESGLTYALQTNEVKLL